MKLWVFGDSYAVHHVHHGWTWIGAVGSSIGADEIRANAVYGSALSWTYHRFELARSSIAPGDVLLVALTSIDRVWFFPELPYFSSPLSIGSGDADGHLSRPQCQAALAYYRYLDDQDQRVLQLVNWLDMLDAFVLSRRVRCLVLPSFPDSRSVIEASSIPLRDGRVAYGSVRSAGERFHSCIGRTRWQNLGLSSGGDLFSVYRAECANYDILPPPADMRRNHLCRDNHEILAAKVTGWVKDGESVVLDGFREGLITKRTLSVENWYDQLLGEHG